MFGNGNLLTIVNNIATFFTTTGGITLVVIGIAIAGIYCCLEGHPRRIGWAIFGGAFVVSASWIVTTWYGASIAGGGGGVGFL